MITRFSRFARLRDSHNQRQAVEDRTRDLIAADFRYAPDINWWNRQHHRWTYREIWDHIRQHGLDVHTQVEWTSTLEHPDWQLLTIRITPLPGHVMPTTRPINPWTNWHFSICYQKDPMTDGDLDYILHKYDNHTFRLILAPLDHPDGSQLELDRQRDPIASDPVVQRLHDNGSYGNRPYHISA